MTNAVAVNPFDFAVPAVAQPRRNSKINAEVMSGGAKFPSLSIKGKVFTLVKDDSRKVLTRKITDDDGNVEEMPISRREIWFDRMDRDWTRCCKTDT